MVAVPCRVDASWTHELANGIQVVGSKGKAEAALRCETRSSCGSRWVTNTWRSEYLGRPRNTVQLVQPLCGTVGGFRHCRAFAEAADHASRIDGVAADDFRGGIFIASAHVAALGRGKSRRHHALFQDPDHWRDRIHRIASVREVIFALPAAVSRVGAKFQQGDTHRAAGRGDGSGRSGRPGKFVGSIVRLRCGGAPCVRRCQEGRGKPAGGLPAIRCEAFRPYQFHGGAWTTSRTGMRK